MKRLRRVLAGQALAGQALAGQAQVGKAQVGKAEDRGAALILVLILVTMVGLSGAALLTFSDTSIRTTVALRDQAGNAYNADGAAQVAIANLSTGYGFKSPTLFDNANDTSCFGPGSSSGTLNLPDFYPAVGGQDGNAAGSASVVCTADPATGVNATDVKITADNRPAQAILTLGQTTDKVGVNLKAQGKPGVFLVNGDVISSSNISVDQGTLQSKAAVIAFGGCTGSIVSTPDARCDSKKTTKDPGYAPEATEVPAYQAVPADTAESCPKGVVTFKPGYYDDASSLNALMGAKATCRGSTWWFTPGTYYFDFHNNVEDSDFYQGPVKNGGVNPDQWAIQSGHLVAGTPTDSKGNIIGSPGPSPTLPGSCLNPIKSTTNQGVQFIFGGDSQLALGGSADAEICGTYNAKRPPIAVFGLRSGEAATTTLSGEKSALKMSTVAKTQAPFVNPTEIIEEDNKSANWVNTSVKPVSATITGSGYAPPTPIPAGSIVKSATIRVRHGNTSGYVSKGTPKDSLSVLFTPTGGTAMTFAPELNAGVGLTTDVIDIPPDFAKFVHDKGYTGATMAYTANLTHKGTESLDAIQIDISYVAPAFRSQDTEAIRTNCITTLPYGSKGSCAVLSTQPSLKGSFYVQGTTYTPKAAIDLTLNQATQQVLRFGVISRSLWITETESFNFDGPVIEVPDITSGGNRAPVVYLTVYICPATTTSTCSTDASATKALRVRARIDDTASPAKVTVLSWSNLR